MFQMLPKPYSSVVMLQCFIDEEKGKLRPGFQILQIKQETCKKENIIFSCMYNNFTYTTKNPNNCVHTKMGDFVLDSRMTEMNEEELNLFGT